RLGYKVQLQSKNAEEQVSIRAPVDHGDTILQCRNLLPRVPAESGGPQLSANGSNSWIGLFRDGNGLWKHGLHFGTQFTPAKGHRQRVSCLGDRATAWPDRHLGRSLEQPRLQTAARPLADHVVGRSAVAVREDRRPEPELKEPA